MDDGGDSIQHAGLGKSEEGKRLIPTMNRPVGTEVRTCRRIYPTTETTTGLHPRGSNNTRSSQDNRGLPINTTSTTRNNNNNIHPSSMVSRVPIRDTTRIPNTIRSRTIHIANNTNRIFHLELTQITAGGRHSSRLVTSIHACRTIPRCFMTTNRKAWAWTLPLAAETARATIRVMDRAGWTFPVLTKNIFSRGWRGCTKKRSSR
mmetsp:Transcript_53883/g.110218  ORF Transcript_53883/g.110218 Transcript_53883/m.110218 type:complete len:205 (-) Transcript_53883:1305-1919(-)